MADMILFLDPQCRESNIQMINLEKAGYSIDCKDLTFYRWTKKELLPFVRGRDPLQIMNCKAPLIMQRKIDPLLLTFEEALEMMLQSPSLIKGPLIQVDDLHMQGCSDQRLHKYLARGKGQNNTQSKPSRLELMQSRNKMRLQRSPPLLPYFGCSFA